MKHATDEQKISRSRRPALGRSVLIGGIVAAALTGLSAADEARTLADMVKYRPTTVDAKTQERLEELASNPAAAQLAERWGIEVTSIRLTAHGHMIDYRYRVLDAAKAEELFKRHIKPQLIHEETGSVLVVPDTAKVGPLRNSNTPQNGKVYWMFFGNAEQLVHSGDPVTVIIGDCRVENLIVG